MSDATSPAAQGGVRPMSGDDLRLLSAWAGGMPDHELSFVYDGSSADPDALLTRLPTHALVPGGGVVIPSWTGARPDRLRAFEATVDGAGATFPAGDWTAAFWSESSVEKFVVPYLAALTGAAAAEVLERVATAWNRWPDDRPVSGLLLRGRREEGASLALGELVDVLYLDRSGAGAELRVSALEEFLAGIDPVPAPTPLPAEPVAYVRGPVTAASPRWPSQFDLRRMAEWAASLREKPMYFLFDVVDGSWSAPVAALPDDLTDRVVIPAYTPTARPDRPTPSHVTLRLEGGESVSLDGREVDAAFWGTGAVDLVLIPYYAGAYGARALGEMAEIDSAWTGRSSAAGAGAEAGAETEEPSAIVHFPKSDWGTVTDQAASALPLTHNLGVVWVPGGAPGAVRVDPLTAFRRG
jgi:hypothetical protein